MVTRDEANVDIGDVQRKRIIKLTENFTIGSLIATIVGIIAIISAISAVTSAYTSMKDDLVSHGQRLSVIEPVVRDTHDNTVYMRAWMDARDGKAIPADKYTPHNHK